MKLKEAKKKYNFLKKLELSDSVFLNCANGLEKIKEGDKSVHMTPLATKCNPFHVRVDWDIIFDANKHKLNPTLLNLEYSNQSKFGSRSEQLPWADRVDDLKRSFVQDESHIPKFYPLRAEESILSPISRNEAMDKMKSNSSAGLPFLTRKERVKQSLLDDFYTYLDKETPAILFTRTQENKKTRNVWGYPFADSLFEMCFYAPLLVLQKKLWHRAALVHPDVVAQRISEMIHKARASNRWLYSVDFRAFDASVRYQYIIEAFEYIKSCFDPMFSNLLAFVCKRFYSIAIVTPVAIFKGKHGVPSGSTFTNEVDSIVQEIIALVNRFIKKGEYQIQGDDGVYIMPMENVEEFEQSFKYAGLEMSDKAKAIKSHLSQDYVVYCQLLYHIDYQDENGFIGGIYPVYRAINRLLFQERFVNFHKAGMKGRDYFGIRTLSILENCKYHPLHEELVRFILAREKYSLDVSDDGLTKYCSAKMEQHASNSSGNQYGDDVFGIRNFVTYKLVAKILAEEPQEDVSDV